MGLERPGGSPLHRGGLLTRSDGGKTVFGCSCWWVTRWPSVKKCSLIHSTFSGTWEPHQQEGRVGEEVPEVEAREEVQASNEVRTRVG